MKHLALAFFILITMGHGTITYAQDSIIGTYTGSYKSPSPLVDDQMSVRLIIASIENGAVKGTAHLYVPACAGDYPMEGKYDGNKLLMRATAKGGPTGDCFFFLDVTQEGNKLVGTTVSGQPIQLSK